MNMPDPIKEDLIALHHANTEFTNSIIDLERKLREMRHQCDTNCEKRR